MKLVRMAVVMGMVMAGVCFGGLRGPGKYSGVVIFDRWGGCMLYSGVYVTYVSEQVKEELRRVDGKCVQVDATNVWQPVDPGDALIRNFTLLGAAPERQASGLSPAGVKLTVRPAFEDGEKPAFVIRVENEGEKEVTVIMDALAPTVLAKKGPKYWGPADGLSEAVVTRQAFRVGAEMRMKGSNETWQWQVTSPEKLEPRPVLPAKGAMEITIALTMPEGQYEMLAGYGGGVQESMCVASNLVGFDVGKDGTGEVVGKGG